MKNSIDNGNGEKQNGWNNIRKKGFLILKENIRLRKLSKLTHGGEITAQFSSS